MTAPRAAMRSFCALLHTLDRLFLYPQTTPPGIQRKAHDKAFLLHKAQIRHIPAEF